MRTKIYIFLFFHFTFYIKKHFKNTDRIRIYRICFVLWCNLQMIVDMELQPRGVYLSASSRVETMTWNFEEEEIRYTRNCKYIWFQKLEPFWLLMRELWCKLTTFKDLLLTQPHCSVKIIWISMNIIQNDVDHNCSYN